MTAKTEIAKLKADLKAAQNEVSTWRSISAFIAVIVCLGVIFAMFFNWADRGSRITTLEHRMDGAIERITQLELDRNRFDRELRNLQYKK